MYIAYIVKRTQIYLDEEQDRRLADRAAAAGTTKSAVIRKAIDDYLSADGGRATRLERFREAVRAAAGSIPRLPSGKEYVEEIRRADAARQREIERRRSRTKDTP